MMNPDETAAADPADEQLLAELRAAATALDPVPASVISAAEAGWTWRTIDAELADLINDSADERELTGVRGPAAGTRLVTFEAVEAGLDIEVEIAFEGDRCRLEGQLVPPVAGTVSVDHAGGSDSVVADDTGRFSFAGISRGPLRLRISGVAAVTTSWIAL